MIFVKKEHLMEHLKRREGAYLTLNNLIANQTYVYTLVKPYNHLGHSHYNKNFIIDLWDN